MAFISIRCRDGICHLEITSRCSRDALCERAIAQRARGRNFMSGDLIPDERGRVIIRRASLEDLDDVVTIWTDGQICQCNIPIEHEKAMGLFRGRIQSQTDCYGVWVAECDGVVVGWQSLTTGRANPTHRWAESSTYIRKENAGRGIGRRLLTFITQHAKS